MAEVKEKKKEEKKRPKKSRMKGCNKGTTGKSGAIAMREGFVSVVNGCQVLWWQRVG